MPVAQLKIISSKKNLYFDNKSWILLIFVKILVYVFKRNKRKQICSFKNISQVKSLHFISYMQILPIFIWVTANLWERIMPLKISYSRKVYILTIICDFLGNFGRITVESQNHTVKNLSSASKFVSTINIEKKFTLKYLCKKKNSFLKISDTRIVHILTSNCRFSTK